MTAPEHLIMERLDRIEQMLAMIAGSPAPVPSPSEAKPRPGTLKARIATALEDRDRKRALREAQA